MEITKDNNEITLHADDLQNLVANGVLQVGQTKIIFIPPPLTNSFVLKVDQGWGDANLPPNQDESIIQTVEYNYSISTIYRQGKGNMRTLAEIAAAGMKLRDLKLEERKTGQ